MTTSDSFEKKIVKIFKALRLMEQAKHLEPKFSDGLQELAKYAQENKKSSDN
jgi:ABC-type hemin transport system substrate-binding protein